MRLVINMDRATCRMWRIFHHAFRQYFHIFFYIYNENIMEYLNKYPRQITRKRYKTILINFLQQD